MNIVYSLRHFFYILRFCGTFPFEIIAKSRLAPTIAARLSICGIPGTFVAVLVYFYGFTETPSIKGGRFRTLLLKLAFTSTCTVYLSVVLLANWTYAKQKQFYDTIVGIDTSLLNKFQTELNHRKLAWNSIALIAATAVYYLVTLLIVIMYSHRIGNFVFMFTEEYQRFQSSLCFIAFNVCVCLLHDRLTAFNRHMIVYMQTKAMTAAFVCFAVDVHDRLRIGVEYLNSIYGSSLTVIFSFYFYRVTSQLFGILDFFGGEGPKYL